VEIRYPLYSSDLVAAGNSQVPKVRTVQKRRKISGHQGHIGEHNCGIKYSSSRYLQWLFYETFRKL